MTPAIDVVTKQSVPHRVHEYGHDTASDSYGLEAAEKLGLAAERVFKTLVVATGDGELVVAVVPVAKMLSLKHLARALGVKKAGMADKALAQRATGYVLGGVSPLGQKKRLRTVIDVSAKNFATIFVSAGRRGLELELAPQDLSALLNAFWAELAQ